MNNIQIFSLDNTTTTSWNLPFIRLGRYPFSTSIINDILGDNINQYELPLDMINGIWWIFKHIKEFGNPTYIGICHQKRFFTHCLQCGVLPFKEKEIDCKYITTPLQQLSIINSNKLDGLITFPWYEDFYKNPSSKGYGKIKEYKYCWEGTYQQFQTDNVGLPYDYVKLAYDNLYLYSPDYLKPFIKKAYEQITVHFCSIFTLSSDLFNLYCDVVLKSLLMTFSQYDRDIIYNKCNCRVGGYLLERVGSCFFWALKLSNKKLSHMSIVETDCQRNPIYRSQTCKDAGLKYNLDSFKDFVNNEIKN